MDLGSAVLYSRCFSFFSEVKLCDVHIGRVTLSYPAGHLCAPYRSAHFLPAEIPYPPVMADNRWLIDVPIFCLFISALFITGSIKSWPSKIIQILILSICILFLCCSSYQQISLSKSRCSSNCVLVAFCSLTTAIIYVLCSITNVSCLSF